MAMGGLYPGCGPDRRVRQDSDVVRGRYNSGKDLQRQAELYRPSVNISLMGVAS